MQEVWRALLTARLPSPPADVVGPGLWHRHVLWSLPDPALALRRWLRLLRPSGRLILIDGS